MNKRMALSAAAVIFLVSFGVFANTLVNGFVYDDAKQILANPWLTDVHYLVDIFKSDVWGFWPERASSAYYRPLMHTLNLAVYQTAGFSPWAFHLVNVLFHAGNSVLVFFLALELFKGKGKDFALSLAFVAALLFATHPIHSEAVAWAGGIPDLSFTFFLLLSFYCYLRSAERENKSPVLGLASLAAFVLALLSKEPALVLLLILVLHDYSATSLRSGVRIRKYIPYLVIAIAYLAVRFAVLGGVAPPGGNSQPLLNWLPDVFVLFANYLGKLLLPINLNAYYAISPAGTFLTPAVLAGIAVTAAFATALIVSFKKSRPVFTALLFIAAPLLPALYIPAIGGTPFAERYLYLPSFGYAILLSLVLSLVTKRLRQGALPFLIAGVGVAMLYSAGAFARNQVWQDDYSLWFDTVQKSPNSSIPRNNLGRAYFIRGEHDMAIKQYQAALQLNPDHAEAHNNLGAALATKNMTAEAEQHFLAALRLKPDYSDAHNNIGILYGSQGQLDKAISHFQMSLQSRPDFAGAHYNLAVTYMAKGSVDLAIKHFQAALRINPDVLNTHLRLAAAYEMKGLTEEAQKHRMRAKALAQQGAKK